MTRPTRFTPILFPPEMVRAILHGRKVETRRARPAVTFTDRYAPHTVMWVREAFNETDGLVMHRADADAELDRQTRWTPAIHMPVQACRLWLRVTECRVEGLGRITNAAARDEGFADRDAFIETYCRINRRPFTPTEIVGVIRFDQLEDAPDGWHDYVRKIERKR